MRRWSYCPKDTDKISFKVGPKLFDLCQNLHIWFRFIGLLNLLSYKAVCTNVSANQIVSVWLWINFVQSPLNKIQFLMQKKKIILKIKLMTYHRRFMWKYLRWWYHEKYILIIAQMISWKMYTNNRSNILLLWIDYIITACLKSVRFF